VDHNSKPLGNSLGVVAEPLPRSFGRSAFVRAARTNQPLALPAGMRSRSPEGRRWRDLCRHYGNRLGAERLADEATRAKLLALIHLTMRLELARDAATPLPLHSELHAVQELRTLLQDLGVSEPQSNGSGLRDYLNGGTPPDPVGGRP
jgi:hypothetical protein